MKTDENSHNLPAKTSSARLDTIWQQVQKHNAVLFLRHALKIDMTMQELQEALEFRGLGASVGDLRLKDVLLLAQQGSAEPSSHRGGPTPAKEGSQRRPRRGPEEMQKLRDEALARLGSAVGSVTTSHLCGVLNKGGFDVDLLQMNRLLSTLAEEGYLLSLGGKPKKWRLKPQGRTAPEPMVVVRRVQPS